MDSDFRRLLPVLFKRISLPIRTILTAAIVLAAGACSEDDGDSARCPLGGSLCGDTCTQILNDNNHCGGCNIQCAPGTQCSSGACTVGTGETPPNDSDPATGCAAGEQSCPTGCQNLLTDPSHCGSCGNECSESQICSSGSCSCPASTTLCGEQCVDVSSDTNHCGTCDSPCTAGQVCLAGVCSCPDGQQDCGGDCSDLLTDPAHCGTCDNACASGEACNAGVCECPTSQTICAGSCVDMQTSPSHCGACNQACPPGQVCQGGSCQCPATSTVCEGVCSDTLTDPAHCGACGNACPFGNGCAAGVCQSDAGALGPDGCEGLAQGLTVSAISTYQTIEVPIVADGMALAERRSDLVVGRQTLVRVFVDVADDWQPRQLSARLYLGDQTGGNQTASAVLYTEQPQTINGASFDEAQDGSFEEARASTFEFIIPSADSARAGQLSLTETTQFRVEVVECGEAPGTPVLSPRFPAEGGAEMGAIDVGPVKVRFVPILFEDNVTEVSEAMLEPYIAALRATYPASTIEYDIRDEPLLIMYPYEWVTNVSRVRYLRQQDEVEQDVYYYGMFRPEQPTFEAYCAEAPPNLPCMAGVGFTTTLETPELRASIGVTYEEFGVITFLHELAHNMGRDHANCPEGRVPNVDPNFPYPGAVVSVRGYDARTDQLMSSDRTDLMSYCVPDQWLSDYTYNGILERVKTVNGVQQSINVDPARIGDFEVLLLEPNRPPRWTDPIIGGRAPGIAESALALDAQGAVVDSVTIYRSMVPDLDARVLAVPSPANAPLRSTQVWHAVQLVGESPVPLPSR